MAGNSGPAPGHGWFGLSAVKDIADALFKLAAAVAIVSGISVYLFRADVGFVAPAQRVDEGAVVVDRSRLVRCHRPGSREDATGGPSAVASQRCVPGFFQAEIDLKVLRSSYAQRSEPMPPAIEELAVAYNADNERDLADQYNSTQALQVPIADLCSKWGASSEEAFGTGFCSGGGPKQTNERRLGYKGRTYERQLVAVNELGIGGLPPPRLPGPQLRVALDLLHASDFSVGRVVLKNFGRATATDVRVFAPAGYEPVGTGGEKFSLQPGSSLPLRFETQRGSLPITEDRAGGFDVEYQTGKGYVPGGSSTVIFAAIAVGTIVAAAAVADAVRRRSAPAP